jgi:hypothetical protein
MRTTAYRVFVLSILLVSPVLFPLLLSLLRVLDGQWPQGGLAEMYRFAWKQLMRGYP